MHIWKLLIRILKCCNMLLSDNFLGTLEWGTLTDVVCDSGVCLPSLAAPSCQPASTYAANWMFHTCRIRISLEKKTKSPEDIIHHGPDTFPAGAQTQLRTPRS